MNWLKRVFSKQPRKKPPSREQFRVALSKSGVTLPPEDKDAVEVLGEIYRVIWLPEETMSVGLMVEKLDAIRPDLATLPEGASLLGLASYSTGHIWALNGNLGKARYHYLTAMDTHDQLPFLETRALRVALSGLAKSYLTDNAYHDAATWFVRLLELADLEDDALTQDEIWGTKLDLADCYLALNDAKPAQQIAQSVLGEALRELGDDNQALVFPLDRLEAANVQLGDLAGASACYDARIDIYRQNRSFEDLIYEYEAKIKFAASHGLKDVARTTWRTLVKALDDNSSHPSEQKMQEVVASLRLSHGYLAR